MAASSSSPLDSLKALWQRLNADPSTPRARKREPDWVVLNWGPNGVTVMEAHVGSQITVKKVFDLEWGGASNPNDSIVSAASLLKDRLASQKVQARQAAVIVDRDAVVVRRLEVPAVPDDDLPDIIRFQAATRTATPLERLSLDFISLDAVGDGPRNAVLATLELSRLKQIQDVVQGAGLQLETVGLTSTALVELAGEAAAGNDLSGLSLVVYQHQGGIELSTLDGGRLAFTHSIPLNSADSLGSFPAELTRAMVALGQSHRDLPINRVFLIPVPGASPALQELLNKRFEGRIVQVDPREHVSATALATADGDVLARCAPSIGLLLSQKLSRLPVIDFANPRKRIEKPDNSKQKYKLAGGGLVLLALLGYWMNLNAVADRNSELADIDTSIADADETLRKGVPIRDAAARLDRWASSNPQVQDVMAKLLPLLPPPSEMVLANIDIKPPTLSSNAATVQAAIKAECYFKNEAVLNQFQTRLVSEGYSIAAYSPRANKADPDYPVLYELTASQLIVTKPPAGRAAPNTGAQPAAAANAVAPKPATPATGG